MAYALAGLNSIGGIAKPTSGPGMWSYKTADAIGVVRASGYFNNARTLLQVGDIIFARCSFGGVETSHVLKVLTNSGGVVTTGGLNVGSSAAVGVVALTLALTPLAQANTDFTMTVPNPASLLRATAITTVAYTGATVTLQLGSTAGGVDLVAAASIKSTGIVAQTLLPAGYGLTGGTVYARLAQTTPTNVGTGVLVLEYLAD